MTARHLAPSSRRTSTSELLGAEAGRRGMVPVEISHPVSKRLAGASHYYGGPLFAGRVAVEHPARETAERDREFVRPA
jgi:hypothetical protein